jgi:hypothetical protein
MRNQNRPTTESSTGVAADRFVPGVDANFPGDKTDKLRHLHSGGTPPIVDHRRGDDVDPYQSDLPADTTKPIADIGVSDNTTQPGLQKDGPKGDAARTWLGAAAMSERPDARENDPDTDPTEPSQDTHRVEQGPDPDEPDGSGAWGPPANWFTADTQDKAPEQGDLGGGNEPPNQPPDVPGPPDQPGESAGDGGHDNDPAPESEVAKMTAKLDALYNGAPYTERFVERQRSQVTIGNLERAYVHVRAERQTTGRASLPGNDTTTEQEDQTVTEPVSRQKYEQAISDLLATQGAQGTAETSARVSVTYVDSETGIAVDVRNGETTLHTRSVEGVETKPDTAGMDPGEEKMVISTKIIADAMAQGSIGRKAPHLDWVDQAEMVARMPALGGHNPTYVSAAASSLFERAPDGVDVDHTTVVIRTVEAGDSKVVFTPRADEGPDADTTQPYYEARVPLPTKETLIFRKYPDGTVMVNDVDTYEQAVHLEAQGTTATPTEAWFGVAAMPEAREAGWVAPTNGLVNRMSTLLDFALTEHGIPVPGDVPDSPGDTPEIE